MADATKINDWLRETGLNTDDGDDYDGFCYILGDFSDSKDYYKKLADQFSVDLENNDISWTGWKNKNYHLTARNCTQETMKGLYLGRIGANGENSVQELYTKAGYCIAGIPNSNLVNLQRFFGSKTLNWWE